jgi:hypothetical protein
MSLTKQERVLAIIRNVDRIGAKQAMAKYFVQYGERISPAYFYRCTELLKQDGLIVSVKRGVYQMASKYQEELKNRERWKFMEAMGSRSDPPPKIRVLKDIPFVYWYKCIGFGTRGEERVIVIPVGTVGEYDSKRDQYVFKIPGELPAAYRRWTAQQMRGFFEAAL